MPASLYRILRSPGLIVPAVAAMIVAAYVRIYFGVELTDEAFYMGMVYTLFLKGQLFTADLFYQNLGTALSYPIFYPFFARWGHEFPMFLLGRHLYFFMTLIGAYSVYSLMTTWLPRLNALLVSTLVIVFVPFSIPNVSYNTVSYLSFLMFLCWGYRGVYGGGRGLHLTLSGAFAAIAAVVYPTLVLAIATFVAMLAYHLYRHDRTALPRAIGMWSLGAVPAGLILLGVTLSSGLGALQDSLGFSREFGNSVSRGSLLFIRKFFSRFPKPLFLVIIGGIWFVRKYPTEDRATKLYHAGNFLILSILCMLVHRSSLYVIIYMTVACLLSFVIFRLRPLPDWKDLRVLIVPPIVAGVCTGWTSGNNFMNAALGLVVGLAVLLALYFLECDRVPASSPLKNILPAQYCGLVLLILLTSLKCYYVDSYREDPVPTLTERITRGPYTGLYTSAARKAYVDRFMAAMDEIRPRARTIMFMDELPLGYLFSDLEPKSRMLLLAYFPYEGALKRYINGYYDDPSNHPDALVVRVEGVLGVAEYPLKTHLLGSSDYRLVKSIMDDRGRTVQFMLRGAAVPGVR